MTYLKIKSNLNAFWIGATATFLGGLAGIWWLSERIQYAVNIIIIPASDGVSLSGLYKINAWIIFLILLSFLVLTIVCLSLIREVKTISLDDSSDVGIEYVDLLRRVENFVEKLSFSNHSGGVRADVISVHWIHTIDSHGGARVTRLSKILSIKTPLVVEFVVAGIDERERLTSYHDVNYRAIDKDKGNDLDWIPTRDSLYEKRFAILLPEIDENEEKWIQMTYRVPGYFRSVLEGGSAEFWWFNLNSSDDKTTDLQIEWLYERGCPQVIMRLQGHHGDQAKLSFEHRPEGVVWIYHDPLYRYRGRDSKIIIERA
jgi:hypothetical protein